MIEINISTDEVGDKLKTVCSEEFAERATQRMREAEENNQLPAGPGPMTIKELVEGLTRGITHKKEI